MNRPNFQFYHYVKPAFADKTKYVIIRAWRQSWKTFWACQWICYNLMRNPKTRWLWVDTVQANISKYIDRYFRVILWTDFWKTVDVDNQKYILKFMNWSILDFGSAERPENLEWFAYDFVVLNEAWIILKKEWLRDKTILPMTKSAKVKIVWTPKWKTGAKYYELSKLCKTSEHWKEYHFTAYDSPEYTPEQLEEIKSIMPPYQWMQEYMAEFVDLYEWSIINVEDIRYYDHINLDDFDNLYMHCDTTHTWKTTSDYFCWVIMWEHKKDKNYYVVDFVLDKLDVERQARIIISLYQKYWTKIKKLTYDEKANQWFGYWIKKLAREDYGISLPIEELKYPNDKISHFEPHIPHFKANRVYLPRNHKDITTATNQLFAFPTKWINDDFVDWLSWVLDNYQKPQEYEIFIW